MAMATATMSKHNEIIEATELVFFPLLAVYSRLAHTTSFQYHFEQN